MLHGVRAVGNPDTSKAVSSKGKGVKGKDKGVKCMGKDKVFEHDHTDDMNGVDMVFQNRRYERWRRYENYFDQNCIGYDKDGKKMCWSVKIQKVDMDNTELTEAQETVLEATKNLCIAVDILKNMKYDFEATLS